MILPELDQFPLFSALLRSPGGTNGFGASTVGFSAVMTSFNPPNVVLQTVLSVYRCPSDSADRLVAIPLGGLNGSPPGATMVFGRSNYPGILGSRYGSRSGLLVGDGTFAESSFRRFSQYTDGLSNTFLVGERRSPAVVNGQYTGGDTIWAGANDDNFPDFQGFSMHMGACDQASTLNLKTATPPSAAGGQLPYRVWQPAYGWGAVRIRGWLRSIY